MFGTSCKKCQVVRGFLACAFILITLIGFRPEQAQMIAGVIPSALTLGILGMVFGTIAFAIRYRNWQHRRQ